jgi:hypothetical protein
MLQHEVEERLLGAGEARVDDELRPCPALLARERRDRVAEIGEHLDQVAVLGVDDGLHLGELRLAEASVGESGDQACAGVGQAQSLRSSSSSLTNSDSRPNSASINCWADIGVPSGCQKEVTVLCWIARSLPSASFTRAFLILRQTQDRRPQNGQGRGASSMQM